MAADNSKTQNPSDSLLDVIETSRVITETASDAIITIDETSTIVYVNRATSNVFGYTTEELIGSELTMLMPEYLRHLHRVGLRNYIETGQKHIAWEAVELPGLHKSGRQLDLELSFGEFRKNNSRFFTGIARDITKRKRDERRLALQHATTDILAHSNSLNEAAPKLLEAIATKMGWQFAAFWLWQSPSNRLVSIASWRDQSLPGTAAFATASQIDRAGGDESLPGRIWSSREPIWVSDFSADESFPRAAVAARGNLHSAFGFPIIAPHGVAGVIELFSVKSEKPDLSTLATLVSIGSQIAQFMERVKAEAERAEVLVRAQDARREAEAVSKQLAALQKVTDAALGHLAIDQLLSESLDRIRDVLQVDTVAILLLRKEGDELVAWAAQGLEEEVEFGVRIPVGRGFAGKVVSEARPIIISDVEHADLFNPLLRKKGIKSLLGVPLLIKGRAQGVLHVGTFKPHRFSDDDVRLLELAADRLAMAVETARLYQLEQEARAEAETANRAKDEFLTILSHELRTPLTPIIGWVHMMEHGILSQADSNKALSIINKNAYNLKRLINDLLDVSAILSGKMRIEEASVNLVAVLEESVEAMRSFASEAKVDLQLDISEAARQATVKGDRSRLFQTFSNVIHNAIKFSGPQKVVKISCEASTKHVSIIVKDQGEGIPRDFLPHVFERFRQADGSRTRSFGGLGLGLSLVKSFVEAHNGTIEVSSDGPGKGSTFAITLPLETPIELPDEKVALTPGEKPTGVRVLIVEDQPDTLEMLTANFRSRGFETIACESAKEALDCINRHHFDILISDIAMPEMDGLQLMREVRRRPELASVPAIALTGYASQTDANAAIEAGFDLHLSKPIDPSDLATAVHNLVALQRGQKA